MADVKVIKASDKKVNRNGSKKIERIRVAAYCRVSTDTEEQLTSYNSQVIHYRNFVEEEPAWELVDIYADEGISGTQSENRIEFQKMINDAVDGKIDLIITKSISRFARNTLDTLKYVRLLKEHNVAILFEKESINTLTMNGEMLLVILSSLAQQESESLSENVKMGLKMKMKRGEMVGYSGCLGYDYNPIDKSLTINEEEAEIVKYIFRRYVEGAGAFTIAKELTQLEYTTKRGGNLWHESTVRGIIRNEKYKGDLLLGKTFTVDTLTHKRLENRGEEDQYYVSNHHEAIITAEIFETAKNILEKRSSRHNNKGKMDKLSKKYAFSCMMKCAFCGSTIIRRTWHSKSVHEKYAWCCVKATKHGKKYCPNSKGIHEVQIEKAFVDAFNMLCSDNKDIITEFLNEMEESLSNLDTSKEIKRVQKEIDLYENKMNKLVDMRLDDIIDKETYELKYVEFSNEIQKYRKEMIEFKLSLDEKTSIRSRMKKFRDVYEKNDLATEFNKQVFESVIEQVIIGKTDENGVVKPYYITFIFKTGFELASEVSKKKPKINVNESKEKMCSYPLDEAR